MTLEYCTITDHSVKLVPVIVGDKHETGYWNTAFTAEFIMPFRSRKLVYPIKEFANAMHFSQLFGINL